MPASAELALIGSLRLLAVLAVAIVVVTSLDISDRQVRLQPTRELVFLGTVALWSCHDNQSFVIAVMMP